MKKDFSMQMIWPFLIQVIILFVMIGGIIFLIYHYIVLPVLKSRKDLAHMEQALTEEQKVLVPLRLQACERFILYLERISPNNLLLRINQPGQSAREFQSTLLRTIREEFDYNLSQQLYVSPETWELIRHAKEEAISLVNRAAAALPENANSSDLSRIILDLSMEKHKLPASKAIEAVKQEIRLR